MTPPRRPALTHLHHQLQNLLSSLSNQQHPKAHRDFSSQMGSSFVTDDGKQIYSHPPYQLKDG